jgi:dihydrofolate reductase
MDARGGRDRRETVVRDVTYYVATSIDGRIAAPDGDWSAFPVEGDHMETIVREYADTLPGHVQRALGVESDQSRFDTVVMGWATYTPALDAGIASPYPHLAQVVASRQARDVPAEVTLAADPVATVRELRARPGSGIWIAGGGALAGSLLDEIDHLVLKVNPVVLGDGIPLFGGSGYEPTAFARTRVREFESGVTIMEYTRTRPRA